MKSKSVTIGKTEPRRSPRGPNRPHLRAGLLGLLAAIGLSLPAEAETLFKFELNEGAGSTVTNVAKTLVGYMGAVPNPNSYPSSNPSSPAGVASDLSLTIADPTGFLVADSTNSPALADLSKPITAEAWVFFPIGAEQRWQGIVGYGNSWKLGLMSDGQLAFTLFGVVDIASGAFPEQGVWNHVAAAWDPGVGVTFFVNGTDVGMVEETRAMRAPNGTTLGLGSAGTGEPINGSVDRIRIHRAVLTAADLDSKATTPKAPLASTVISYGFNEKSAPYTSEGSLKLVAKFAQDVFLASQSPTFTVASPTAKAGDTALLFDGNDTVFVEDPNQVVTLESGDFTIQAWVQFGAQSQGRSVIFANNGPGGAMSFSVTQDRRVFVTTYGILDIQSAAFIPNDPLWHHIAVIHRNGTDMRFFVDGALGDTISYSSGLNYSRTDTHFQIGSEFGLGLPFKGSLDRLQLANTALDPKDLDFLAVPGVVPGAPTLEIGTAVSVSWPATAVGFILQSTTDLTEPKVWTTVTAPSTVVGDKVYVLLPTTDKQTFYRMVRPATP